MYTKPIIYKIYSIVIFAAACLGFLSSLVASVSLGGAINSILPKGYSFSTLYIITLISASLVSLFFSYIEFSSMFTFAQMIEHEESGSALPFQRMGIALPPGFYRVFGNIMFYVPLVVDFIAVIVLIISYSITQKAFIAIPIIPIAILLLGLFLSYITYYCRYRILADLMDLKRESGNQIKTIARLAEHKPNMLRGYCVFLFILAIINVIVSIVSLFFIAGPLSGAIGVPATIAVCIGIVLSSAVSFMVYGIIGCYYDNIAKMLEHYMIKYKMI